MKTSSSRPILLVLSGLLAVLLSTGSATTYDWDGNGAPSAGGNWSATNNWNPDSTANGPTAGDTANLVDTTTNRTVTYDTSATGNLTTLNVNQTTAGITNTLDLQKSLTLTNLITLGATSATERIIIGSTSSAGFILTPSGGLTLDAGGNLVMTATGNGTTGVNLGNTGGSGLLTVQGGTLTIAGTTGTTSATSAANTLSMGLTMTSGALTIDNTTGLADRRVVIQGTVNVSGGDISTTRSGGGGAITFQSTNAITWNPTTFDTDITLSMETSGNQSLTTDKTLFVVQARTTGVKTLTSTASGNGIAQLQLFDNNSTTNNSRTTLRLGSNLTSTSGAGMPAAQSFGNTHESGRIDLGIDTQGFTLDLSAGASSGVWTPNASTQAGVTSTVWTLSGTTNGAIKANAFNLTTANVTTDVGAGTVLNAVGGNSTANNLGGTGTINADSIFRYSGAAATNTPATLTSSRNLGDIEVTSGALKMLTASVGTAQDLRVSGGTFDLDANTGRTFASISLTGGTLTNGTFATSEAAYTNLQTGTVAGKLTGAKQLIKNSAGTLTLSGNNDYSLSTVVQSGTLAITTSSAFTGTSSLEVTGGTLDLGGTTLNKFITSLTNGGVIQNGTFQRTSVTGWTLHDGTISANLTTTGIGEINLNKSGAGTVVLSGANVYAGGTQIFGGTLQVGSGGSNGALGSGNITNNATLAFNRTGTLNVASVISGSGVVTKSGAGTVTFSGASANTYTNLTTVSGGTLELSKTAGVNAISGAVTVGTGAKLLISASDQVDSGAGDTVTLSGGTIQRGVGVSETFGNLTLTASSFLDFGGTAEDATFKFGDLTLGSFTLGVSNFLLGNKLQYNAASQAAGQALADTFSFTSSATRGFSYDTGVFTITAIPEPSTVLAALGLTGLMLWPLRRHRGLRRFLRS